MAKINPMELIKSMSRKVCMHSDVYFRTNRQTGVTYSGKLCNPYDGPDSVNQTQANAPSAPSRSTRPSAAGSSAKNGTRTKVS